MLKIRALAALSILTLSLSVPRAGALESDVGSFGCRADSSGASLEIGDKQIGFSSLDQCERQAAEWVQDRGTVICGCETTPAGGVVLSLLALMAGSGGLDMSVSCYLWNGDGMKRIKRVRLGNYSQFDMKSSVTHPEVRLACVQQEASLFEGFNGIALTAGDDGALRPF